MTFQPIFAYPNLSTMAPALLHSPEQTYHHRQSLFLNYKCFFCVFVCSIVGLIVCLQVILFVCLFFTWAPWLLPYFAHLSKLAIIGKVYFWIIKAFCMFVCLIVDLIVWALVSLFVCLFACLSTFQLIFTCWFWALTESIFKL